MKKIDFIEKIKENINKPGGVLAAITDPRQMNLINTNLDNIKKKLQTMGMMEEDIAEALNMGKDYNDQTEFFRDMIDNLMHRYYGVTYYNPAVDEKPIKPSEPEKPEDSQQLSLFPKEKKVEEPKEEPIKPISQMSDSEYNEFVRQRGIYGHNNLFYIINRVKDAEEKLKNGLPDENGVSNPLRIPYLALQDTKRVMEEVKNINENFANSKMFSIIAESETPKISKQEILEFLKDK